jgi:hypothetical protein
MPGQPKHISVKFPAGGLHRDHAYQSQPPYTTPDCLNVRPRGQIEDRLRGGTRPGLAYFDTTRLGFQVQGSSINGAEAAGRTTITDNQTDSAFEAHHVGMKLVFDTSGNEYEIVTYTSATVIVVLGDATVATGGETVNDSWKIYGGEVNMLATLRDVSTSLETVWQDPFPATSTSFQSVWSAASWTDSLPTLNGFGEPTNTDSTAPRGEQGAVRDDLPIDTSQEYTIRLTAKRRPSGTYPPNLYHGDYKVYCCMNDDVDAEQDGVIVTIAQDTGDDNLFNCDITEYATGTPNTLVSATDLEWDNGDGVYLPEINFDVAVNGTTITLTVNDVQVLTTSGSPVTITQGRRLGFGLINSVGTADPAVDLFSVTYKNETLPEANRNRLIAACGGHLYKEDNDGSMSLVASTPRLNHTHPLEAVEYGGKLYILNGVLFSSTTGNSADAGLGNLLANITDDSIGNFETYINEASLPSPSTYIVYSGGKWYPVTAKGSATFRVGGALSDASQLPLTASDDLEYSLYRKPLVYDPSAATVLTDWATGSDAVANFPYGCTSIAVTLDRIAQAGSPVAPQVWYMSKAGDPDTWTVSTDTVADPVAATNSNFAQVPEPITAIVAGSDDYCYFGSSSGLHRLVGDPQLDGRLELRSSRVGFLNALSWTRGPDGTIYFLSKDGIYYLAPGAAGIPMELSDQKLPSNLKDIDGQSNAVAMEYDVFNRGMWVWITGIDGGSIEHYWWDRRLDSWWPMSYTEDHEPWVSVYYEADASARTAVVLGCRDGYLRQFSTSSASDQGTAITNYVYLGPFVPGGSSAFGGLLEALVSVIDSDSGNITVDVYAGNSAEEAFDKTTADFSITITDAGRSYRSYPQVFGNTFYLKISGTGTAAWAMEEMLLKLRRTGVEFDRA